jgi:hypothetical protein
MVANEGMGSERRVQQECAFCRTTNSVCKEKKNKKRRREKETKRNSATYQHNVRQAGNTPT